METLFIPTEKDFKRWISEAIAEYVNSSLPLKTQAGDEQSESFLSRKEVAGKLRVSLVTLTDWVKRGLPSHKQRGRVYFLHSEVMDYIKQHPFRRI